MGKRSGEVVVLLTATVSPSSTMPGSANNDAAIRRDEYLKALSHYLAQPDDIIQSVVILENSGASAEPFRALYENSGSAKSFAFINTTADYDHTRGKGFGEFLMIDAGMKQLVEGGRFSTEAKFWKVTGRHHVLNISDMIRTAPETYDLYCDLRNVPLIGERLGGNRWMDLRVLSFSIAGYRHFFEGRYDGGFTLEKPFFERAYAAWRQDPKGIVPRFRIQPVLRGTNGRTGESYSSPSYLRKERLRALMRRLAPRLWL
ncbi:hypothetical protein V6R86_07385 [Sphingomonas kaistensis]|uniref:Glycosyltransferase family 2 protein n=1 Tax=Sphingomonas kaistensis TaxID=298708 RepID=A0ABZ2G232_9SPHN